MKTNNYVLLYNYHVALTCLVSDLVADEIIRPSSLKRLPKNTALLDFLESKILQTKKAVKKQKTYLERIFLLRRRRFRLVERWKYLVWDFLKEFEKLDPSNNLLNKAYKKIEQAIDKFRGNITILKRRLTQDFIRLKKFFQKQATVTFSTFYPGNDSNSLYPEELLYSSSQNVAINSIWEPSPEIICMVNGL